MPDFTHIDDPAGSYTVPAREAKEYPQSYHYSLRCEYLPRRRDGKPNFLIAKRLPYSAATGELPGPDEAHPKGALEDPESFQRTLRLDDFEQYVAHPAIARAMDNLHVLLCKTAELVSAKTAMREASEVADLLARQLAAARADLDAASQALAGLPAEATDEERAATQARVDAAASDAARIEPALAAAQATAAQHAKTVAAIEAQLQ